MSTLQLDQDVGSLAVFLRESTDVPFYYDNLPESFRCPCLYFEPVHSEMQMAATSYYKEKRTQYVNVYHVTKREAQQLAASLARSIALAGFTVPLVDASLKRCGGALSIRTPRVTPLNTDMGVAYAQIELSWTTHQRYTTVTAPPIRRVFINPEAKNE